MRSRFAQPGYETDCWYSQYSDARSWCNVLTQDPDARLCTENIVFPKVPVPHLKKAVHSCTFLYILYILFYAQSPRTPPEKQLYILVHFQISFASKVLVPHLNFVAEIGMDSVHSCWSDLASPSNLPKCLNPSPDVIYR